jgi:glutamate carboxypeptidase
LTTSVSNIAAFHDYFRGRQEAILAFVRALVEIESPSGYESGSRALVSLLSAAAAGIGHDVRIERISSESYGEHLRVTAFTDSREKPITFIGHTDTVHPLGSLDQRPWRVEGDRAYGPGVFDMKANCALAVEVIRACVTVAATPKRPVVLLLTCDEETGSKTGKQLVEAEGQRAHAVLVLEPPAPGGKAKTGRKGTGMFTLEAHGRAAHAGLEPEKGASAVLELANQTVKLHSLNDHSTGITVNVGEFHGGTLSNVVPAFAKAEIDVRFSTADEARSIEAAIRGLSPVDDRIRLVVKGGINRPPLERSAGVLKLYEQARAIAREVGFDLGEIQVGGASDGNFAAAAGATVLDGLGVAGDGAHATHEHILVSDLARRGALLAGLLTTL